MAEESAAVRCYRVAYAPLAWKEGACHIAARNNHVAVLEHLIAQGAEAPAARLRCSWPAIRGVPKPRSSAGAMALADWTLKADAAARALLQVPEGAGSLWSHVAMPGRLPARGAARGALGGSAGGAPLHLPPDHRPARRAARAPVRLRDPEYAYGSALQRTKMSYG